MSTDQKNEKASEETLPRLRLAAPGTPEAVRELLWVVCNIANAEQLFASVFYYLLTFAMRCLVFHVLLWETPGIFIDVGAFGILWVLGAGPLKVSIIFSWVGYYFFASARIESMLSVLFAQLALRFMIVHYFNIVESLHSNTPLAELVETGTVRVPMQRVHKLPALKLLVDYLKDNYNESQNPTAKKLFWNAYVELCVVVWYMSKATPVQGLVRLMYMCMRTRVRMYAYLEWIDDRITWLSWNHAEHAKTIKKFDNTIASEYKAAERNPRTLIKETVMDPAIKMMGFALSDTRTGCNEWLAEIETKYR